MCLFVFQRQSWAGSSTQCAQWLTGALYKIGISTSPTVANTNPFGPYTNCVKSTGVFRAGTNQFEVSGWDC
jgi:hypothetical protein